MFFDVENLKNGVPRGVAKKVRFWNEFSEKLAVFQGARDANMWFSLGRGASFSKNRLSMLGLQKQSSGKWFWEAFGGRIRSPNWKNEIQKAD